MRDPVGGGEDVLVVVALHGADHHVLRAAAHRRAATHPRHPGIGVLDAPVELIDGVRQRRDVRGGDRHVPQPHGRELPFDGRVGGGADEERVDVVVARDAGVPEALDLIGGDLGDPVRRHVQDGGVVGEVDQRGRRDRRERVVRGQQRQPPRPVGNIVVLVRRVQRQRRRPDVLGDRHRLLIRVRTVQPLRRLRPDRGHQRRLPRRRRNRVIRPGPRRTERVLLRVRRPPHRSGSGRQMQLNLAGRARTAEHADRGEHDQGNHTRGKRDARHQRPRSRPRAGLGGNQSK